MAGLIAKARVKRVIMTQGLVTTIGLRRTTKDRLDKNKAPGQCYDGFVCQLIDLWEMTKERGVRHITGSVQGTKNTRADIISSLVGNLVENK